MLEKYIGKQYKLHFVKTALLALPVVLGQAGHMITGIADNIMVGQTGVVPLAASSFANNIVFVFLVFCIGLNMGITPLVGAAAGKKDYGKCVGILGSALGVSFLAGLAMTLGIFICGYFLGSFGQPPEVVELARPYYKVVGLSLFPLSLFFGYKQYLDGLGDTKSGMYASILGNLINIVLNYALIFGHWGFEPMGVYGAGVATAISRVVMLVYIAIAAHSSAIVKKYSLLAEGAKLSLSYMKEIFGIGLPSAVQSVLEIGAFVCGALIIGAMGAEAIAAHQIVISLAGLTYLMASGVAAAATIRVSTYWGRGDMDGVRVATYTASLTVVAFMSCTAVLFVLGKGFFPSFYVEAGELEVLALAARLMLIAAVFQLFDGVQVVAMGALRGLSDVSIPTIMVLVSYWLIAVPTAYFFGIYLAYGPQGVWIGLCSGLCAASIMLAYRFWRVSAKKIVL